MMGCNSGVKNKQVENLTRKSSVISQLSSIGRSIKRANSLISLM